MWPKLPVAGNIPLHFHLKVEFFHGDMARTVSLAMVTLLINLSQLRLTSLRKITSKWLCLLLGILTQDVLLKVSHLGCTCGVQMQIAASCLKTMKTNSYQV